MREGCCRGADGPSDGRGSAWRPYASAAQPASSVRSNHAPSSACIGDTPSWKSSRSAARKRSVVLSVVLRPARNLDPVEPLTPIRSAQVAFEMRLLIQQYDFLERQIGEAEAQLATLLDGATAHRLLTIPGVGSATAATLLAEIGARLCRRASQGTEFRPERRTTGDQLDDGQDRQRLSASCGLSDGGRGHQAQSDPAEPLRAQAGGRQVGDEHGRSLYEQSPVFGLGRVAQRPGL